MTRHGVAPFLECSSRGFKPFSAFYARIRARGNKSIEEIYQAAKLFEDGSTGLGWREAKGKLAVNISEVHSLYSKLWDEYINENPELKTMLLETTGFSDIYGQKNSCCQATELFRIKNELIKHDSK